MARYGNVDYLVKGLDVLQEFSMRHEILWLPIDAPDRDEWLSALSRGLEMPLSTDWGVIDSRSPPYDGYLPPIGHEGFFKQFYG